MRLRSLGRVLGAARDWDVFVLETLADAAREQPGAGWPRELGRAADGRRAEAHAETAKALKGPGFTQLVLSLAAWVEDGVRDPARLGDKAMRKKLKKIAPEMLDRVHRKARKRGQGIEHLGEEDLHALRKSLKKLRYDAEFFEGLYEHGAVKRYRKHCEALQELLGRFNDARMTAVLAGRLAEHGGPTLAQAAETARGMGRGAARRGPGRTRISLGRIPVGRAVLGLTLGHPRSRSCSGRRCSTSQRPSNRSRVFSRQSGRTRSACGRWRRTRPTA